MLDVEVNGFGPQFIENVEKFEITINNWSKTKSLELDGYYYAYCLLWDHLLAIKQWHKYEHWSQHWYQQVDTDNNLRK